MRIVGKYPFNDPKGIVEANYKTELAEIEQAITAIEAHKHYVKVSEEKTKKGRLLYSPIALNKGLDEELIPMGWVKHRVPCDYPTQYYVGDYKAPKLNKGAFREIDYVKNRVGVEIQFGKYSFMVYNVAAKMTIFHNLGLIDVGIEVVPVKELATKMSSGVSYFEQFLWDLEQRGTSNIDIPVLVIGIMA